LLGDDGPDHHQGHPERHEEEEIYKEGGVVQLDYGSTGPLLSENGTDAVCLIPFEENVRGREFTYMQTNKSMQVLERYLQDKCTKDSSKAHVLEPSVKNARSVILIIF
jgi:hypothetical protein